jgi:hypothetical protein
MSNVTPLGCITRLDLPADRILDAAKGKLESIVIAAFDSDGNEYFASSVADGGTALWLIERFKKRLFEIGDGHE